MTNSQADFATDLVAKMRRVHLVMAPTGRAFENHRQIYVDACDQSFTVSDVLNLSAPPELRLVAVTDLESVEHVAPDGTSPLGQLRIQVGRMLEAGCAVVLLSRYPRLRYPDVPGSSLLEDARPYHPQLRNAEPSEHPLAPFPAWKVADDGASFLTELVEDLGTELVARLDQVLFESVLPPVEALNNLTPPELDALWFSGLVTPVGNRYEWSAPRALKELKEAVANCLTACVEPPADLRSAYETLWMIERRLRQVIRAKAIRLWEHSWKDSLVGIYMGFVLERAGEVAYPGVKKITSVRDPLEWLTLGELLRIREEKSQLGNLGLDSLYWRRLANEVLPIRNQVSHMRFTRPGDLATLRHWDAVLARLLRDD